MLAYFLNNPVVGYIECGRQSVTVEMGFNVHCQTPSKRRTVERTDGQTVRTFVRPSLRWSLTLSVPMNDYNCTARNLNCRDHEAVVAVVLCGCHSKQQRL